VPRHSYANISFFPTPSALSFLENTKAVDLFLPLSAFSYFTNTNRYRGSFMHILSAMVLILGALIVLVLGLVSVLRDLLERGPYEAPLIQEDGMGWPRRLQGVVLANQPIATNRYIGGKARTGSTPWSAEQENSRT
jgi:hypothetical protein